MSVLRIRSAFVALPAVPLLLGLAIGCAGPGEPPADNTAAIETPAETPAAAEPTESAPATPATQEPVAQEKPPANEDRAQQVRDQAVKEKSLIQQKNEFLVGRYVDAARKAMDQGDYARAEESLLRARELDVTNAEVNTLYAQVEEALGKRGGEIENVKDELSRRRLAAAQQQMFRAESLEAEADKAMSEKRYADAINALEEIVSIATWNPYAEVDFGAMRQRAEAKLAQAKQSNRRYAEEQRRSQAREAYQTLQKEEQKERQARVDRIRSLMEDATDRFDRNDFAAAETLADQVLDIDPQFKAAKDLKESSRIARHDKFNSDFVEKKREQYRSWMEDVRAGLIPDGDFLSWPSQAYWDEIKRKRAYAGSIGAAETDSPAVQKIKNQLANIRMDLEFEDATLPAVIDYIRSFTGINMVLDPEVAGEAGTATIKLTLKQVPVRTALNIVLASQENLTYTFKDDVLLITKKDKALGKPVPQIHEVRDIAFGLANFTSPDIRLRTGEPKGENEKPIFGDFKEKEPELKPEDLIELVRTNIAPESWDGQPGTIDATSAGLLVVHTPEVQRQVGKFLNDLRQFLGASVLIESRFLTVTDNFLQDVGVDFRGLGGAKGDLANLDDVTNGLEDNASAGFDNNGQGLATNSSGSPSSGAFFNQGKNEYRARTENLFTRTLGKSLSSTGGLTLQWAYLDDAQLNFVLRSVEKSDRATQLTAPRITAHNTQQASIHVVNQIAYVQDFEVEVAQTAFIADPVIGIIQDGLVLDVRPTISNDRKYVNLELKPTVAKLKQPIPTFTTSLGGLTQPVTIELPELEVSRAATTVMVPDGGTVMIGGLRNVSSVDRKSETPFFADIPLVGFLFSRKGKSEEMRDLLVVVTVHIVDVAEEETRLRH
ncbi:MAG: hypothetical protein HYR85_20370 [Planctomycetes bacterium]|nr:hypothetical protein [Planctomycetota bacterium]MBI3846811.1 hypothetical protein [Planctomycetota bacterium]